MLASAGLIGRVQERGASWVRLGIVSSGYALVVGAASAALAMPDAAGGEAAALVRVGLGLLGVTEGAVLWSQPAREILGTWTLVAGIGAPHPALGDRETAVRFQRPSSIHLGWRLAMLWAIAQIPVAAWTEYGSATLQILEIPLFFTERITVNGEVTSYSGYGITVVAITLAAIYGQLQQRAVLRQSSRS